MSLNVNYTALYQNGIDRSMLKEVSKEILNRAAQKSNQYQNNFSAAKVNSLAKPVELGIDLYNGKLDVQVQKQIALNNSFQFQLNTETLNSIKFLQPKKVVYIVSTFEQSIFNFSSNSHEANDAFKFVAFCVFKF